MKFSDNLVKYRKKAGLTQGQLAAKLSVTPQAVSKWEKGSYPDSELLPELSKALDVSLDVLFGLKSDDGKINATNAAAKKMRSLSDEDKGQFIMELFYSLICTYNPNTDAENISFPESLARETYAHLRSDHALAVSRLNPDMQYICFMRVPEDGINSYFKIQPRIMELFSILSDENALRIINFAETVERNYLLTKECISKELDMPMEVVSEIVEKFDRFGIMWELTVNTGSSSFPIYGYVHNIPLIGILVLANTLVNFLACREPDIDTWLKAPFRAPKKQNENLCEEENKQ